MTHPRGMTIFWNRQTWKILRQTNMYINVYSEADKHETLTRDLTRSRVTRLIHIWHAVFTCDIPHSHVTRLIRSWHDSSTRYYHILRQTTKYSVWHDSFTHDIIHPHVTWLIHIWHALSTRDMPYSRVTWPIHWWLDSSTWYDYTLRQTTKYSAWHDSFTHDIIHPHVTWLIHMWHAWFTRDRGRRRISHWKWTLSFVPRKLRYPPKKRSFQFSPILAFWGGVIRGR